MAEACEKVFTETEMKKLKIAFHLDEPLERIFSSSVGGPENIVDLSTSAFRANKNIPIVSPMRSKRNMNAPLQKNYSPNNSKECY